MSEPFAYWLCIDFDPLPAAGTGFDSLAEASAAIRLRWPNAVLDDEWFVDSDEHGQSDKPVAVGERQEALRFVYPDLESKRDPELADRAESICAILYRKPIGNPGGGSG